MNKNNIISDKQAAPRWRDLKAQFLITPEQENQLARYADLLLTENETHNLTAITDFPGIVRHHFHDSLMVANVVDLSAVRTIADVGTGAGFPGLVLKIMYPHLQVLLIEMNGKKKAFLEQVCRELGLADVQLCDYDWRTFLRVTEGKIDLFVSRAALPTRELARAFKPACSYNTATMVYWASAAWEAEPEVVSLIAQQWAYTLGSRERSLVVLRRP